VGPSHLNEHIPAFPAPAHVRRDRPSLASRRRSARPHEAVLSRRCRRDCAGHQAPAAIRRLHDGPRSGRRAPAGGPAHAAV